MAPPKADGWPAYIFSDPAVRTLDERGRFVICAVCAQYYAICGGKKPKPVTLNGCYRTRAWEVHKQRTRAHNAHREGRSMSPRPSIPVSAAVASEPLLRSLDWRPYESRPLDRLDLAACTSTPPRAINQPPLRDRRRSLSPPQPPPPPITTWRRFNTVASESFSRPNQRQRKPATRRMQSAPSMPSTLVFPLVRRPSDLRRWSDFDPNRFDPTPGHDWRRLLSSSRHLATNNVQLIGQRRPGSPAPRSVSHKRHLLTPFPRDCDESRETNAGVGLFIYTDLATSNQNCLKRDSYS